MLFKLEGFKYAKSFSLNMGYYFNQLNKDSTYLWTIIFPWVKYFYECSLMAVRNSPDIFKQKINNLFQGFEFIRTYISRRKTGTNKKNK